MYGALSAKGMKPARWVGMVYALLAMPVYLAAGVVMLAPLTTVFCMLGLAAVLLRGEIDFDAAVATLFPIFYPGLMFAMVYPLQDLGNPLIASLAIGLTFVIPAMADTAAYFIGCRWGKHKMAPKLSPKKTVEGGLAGLLGALVCTLLMVGIYKLKGMWYAPFVPYADTMPSVWTFIPLGLVSGAVCIMGDLSASMVKRYCGIKDYGTFLPGHGGLMDRVDSVLFNGVVVYSFFLLVMRTAA
jgi:phosphatidate cytidylyltransferase